LIDIQNVLKSAEKFESEKKYQTGLTWPFSPASIGGGGGII
jgi:hypothetical protein